MKRSILLIYLIVFGNSSLSTLLAKQGELTAKHDDLLNQLAIITDENKNYSPSKSPLHKLNARIAEIQDASNTYSIYKHDLTDQIAFYKQAQAEFFYRITELKMHYRYTDREEVKGNLIEGNAQLTTLLKNFKQSKQIYKTHRNSLSNFYEIYVEQIVNFSNKTRNLIKKEIKNSTDLLKARTRITQLLGSDILVNQILIEDVYADEIEAISINNKITEKIRNNLNKEKESRLEYETKLRFLESEADFCLNSFLKLARYFGYRYSAIYSEEAIKYMEKYKKVVKITLDAVDKFSLGQQDTNLKRSMTNLKFYFEKINKKFNEESSFPLSVENHDINAEFSLSEEVIVEDVEAMKYTILNLILSHLENLKYSLEKVFQKKHLTDTLELFLKVINQSEKIEEIWMQVELIKNEIEQLNEKEQRTMYKNEDNFEKFAKLQLETKQIREELKKVNEKILFMIEYNDN